jgi:integrase
MEPPSGRAMTIMRSSGQTFEAQLVEDEFQVRWHMRPVRVCLGMSRAVALITAAVEAFTAQGLRDGKAPATVNREVGALKQALNLARKQARLGRVPYIAMLREDNTRTGFFEWAEINALVTHLPEPFGDMALFAYWTGWRRGELVGLTWDTVDRNAGEVRVRTSKNGKGRVLPLEGPLRDIIERRWDRREVPVSDGLTRLSEFVFHRKGERLGEFRKSWEAACRKAAMQTSDDLRRTAARNMVRSGVPETVAMSITGHVTRSMFDRYNITSGAGQRAALRRVEQHVDSQAAPRAVVTINSRAQAAG